MSRTDYARTLRRAKERGDVHAVALLRIAVAVDQERGVRLTADEVALVMEDHAVSTAIDEVMVEYDEVNDG